MIRFFRSRFLVPFCQCGIGVHKTDHRNSVVRSARYVHAQRAFFCFESVQAVRVSVRKVARGLIRKWLYLLDFVEFLSWICLCIVAVVSHRRGGIRTRTAVRPEDFKSSVSAITPPARTYFSVSFPSRKAVTYSIQNGSLPVNASEASRKPRLSRSIF